LAQLHGEAGVEHVRQSHSLMHEASGLADVLREVGQEGDDVVLGLVLDLADAGVANLPLDGESGFPAPRSSSSAGAVTGDGSSLDYALTRDVTAHVLPTGFARRRGPNP
jgi:hypothetical protein